MRPVASAICSTGDHGPPAAPARSDAAPRRWRRPGARRRRPGPPAGDLPSGGGPDRGVLRHQRPGAGGQPDRGAARQRRALVRERDRLQPGEHRADRRAGRPAAASRRPGHRRPPRASDDAARHRRRLRLRSRSRSRGRRLLPLRARRRHRAAAAAERLHLLHGEWTCSGSGRAEEARWAWLPAAGAFP